MKEWEEIIYKIYSGEMLTSRHDMAIACINSKQLSLPKQDLKSQNSVMVSGGTLKTP